MNIKETSGVLRSRKLLALLLVLAVLVAGWFLNRQLRKGTNESPHPSELATQNTSANSPLENYALGSSSVSTNAQGIAVIAQKGGTNVSRRMDKETMLRHLKVWIRKREGHDIEVVSAEDILDLDGNPASLNVLVTTRLDGVLTAQALKQQLDEANARERVLREQLAKARQAEDVAGVNRLVAELTETRTAFVTNNEVSSYKLSLMKDLPPVLAYWPGLPFESVREQAARRLAESRLGAEIELQGLVHFTSTAALLHFTNAAGQSIYIDPFRVAEVPLATLQVMRNGKRQRDDEGRVSRVAEQWTQFLQP